MPQIFLNNFQAQFVADVRASPQTNNPATELDYGVLRVSDGAAGMLLNPAAGSWYVLTAFKRSGSLETNYEVLRVTAVDNSVVGECRITVQRGQEGMAPQAFARGDLLECRLTAGGMAQHVQTTDLRLSNPRAPTGAAGGVLSGQYPNPGFATPMATSEDLAAGLANKVDKMAGKGLSANDLTNERAAKLDGIADQATKNATDAQLRDRATHTGTQAIATVAGLQAALDAKLGTGGGIVTGPVAMSDQPLSRAMLKDHGYAFFDSAAVNVLDYTNGSHQRWVPATGAQALTIANWPPAGNLGELLLEGVNLGASTITWPAIIWIKADGSGDTTTTFSSAGYTLKSAGIDHILLWSRDGGATTYGKVLR